MADILSVRQKHLVRTHHRLAWQLAIRQYSRCGGELDACVSDAMLSLVLAALRFDPGRGVKFITYAYRAIQLNFYSDRLSRLTSRPDEQTLGDNDVLVVDRRGESPDLCMDVAAALRRLPKQYRQVIERRTMMGCGLHLVGNDLGISQMRVHQIERVALAKLRTVLEAAWGES